MTSVAIDTVTNTAHGIAAHPRHDRGRTGHTEAQIGCPQRGTDGKCSVLRMFTPFSVCEMRVQGRAGPREPVLGVLVALFAVF